MFSLYHTNASRGQVNVQFELYQCIHRASNYPRNFKYESNIQSNSVASNLIRILNIVKMSCQNVASSHGHGHKSKPELSALWPYASVGLFTF